MKKLVFNNYILNLIAGSLLLIAGIIETIGLLGVEEINYVQLGLKYAIGALTVLFAVFNFAKTYKKDNAKASNWTTLIINTLILILGVFLFLSSLNESIAKVFTATNVLGVTIYLEGVLVIVNAAIKRTKLNKTFLGIIIVTLGVVVLMLLKEIQVVYAITFLIIAFGLLYFIFGLAEAIKIQKAKPKKEKKLKEDKKELKEEKEEETKEE